jgi:hypothetical protein
MAKTKVQILNIAYSKRFNLGDYQAEEFKAEGTVEGDPIEGFAQLKGAVVAAADAEAIPWPTEDEPKTTKTKGKANAKVEEADEEDAEEEAPKKKTTKKASKKVEPEPEEEDDEEDSEDDSEEEDDEDLEDAEENSEEEDEESDDEEGDDEEDEKPTTAKGSKSKAGTKAEEPKKKSLKKKGSVYSRTSDLHKQLFVEELKKISKTFLKDHPDKAKSISIKMDGKEFLDADGVVLETFRDTLKKLAKAK